MPPKMSASLNLLFSANFYPFTLSLHCGMFISLMLESLRC
jgi:hypothetical protein